MQARLLGLLLRLPPQVFGMLFAREWFVDPAAADGRPRAVRRDIFD